MLQHRDLDRIVRKAVAIHAWGRRDDVGRGEAPLFAEWNKTRESWICSLTYILTPIDRAVHHPRIRAELWHSLLELLSKSKHTKDRKSPLCRADGDEHLDCYCLLLFCSICWHSCVFTTNEETKLKSQLILAKKHRRSS